MYLFLSKYIFLLVKALSFDSISKASLHRKTFNKDDNKEYFLEEGYEHHEGIKEKEMLKTISVQKERRLHKLHD